jgi:ABC-type branched-subunit amino acid transport system substrate-binding protein
MRSLHAHATHGRNARARFKPSRALILCAYLVALFARSPCTFAESRGDLFHIGVLAPLSGPAADYGVAIQNCIELAKRDRPEIFTNVRFHFEDVPYDPKASISAYRKLVNADHVNIIVVWGVTFCKVIAPLAESQKIPMVGLCLDHTIAAGREYVLRFINTTDEIMLAQAQYLQERGLNRIGILQAEHPYLEEVAEALQRNLRPGQSLEVVDRVPNTDLELRSQVIKLVKRREDFDAIGAFLALGQTSTFYRQARALGFSVPTFGTNFFEVRGEIEASQGAMEGVGFSSISVKEPFIKRYREAFHRENSLSFGAAAYEFAVVAGELFNHAEKKLTAKQFIESLSSLDTREGSASGPYRYVDTPATGRYFQFPVVIKNIQGDRFVEER